MSIRPLPGDVVAQIRSSSAITTLNDAVCGLIRNSLDAGASKINVSVDYSRGNCHVEDNGLGIPPADFGEDGGLGKLHYTSRYPPKADCHGKHGELVASLAALSLLSITSHHHEYRSHNSLTTHNAKVIARNMPALPEQQILAFPSGTRVTVRDLFGSMPVRVKHRALEAERLGTVKNFDQLAHAVVALLLAWPREATVSLRDAHSRRAVSLSTPEPADQTRSSQASDRMVARTTRLLGQTPLAEPRRPESWISVGASADGVSVNGCISLLPVATKRVQFIALGVQPLDNEANSNFFYEDFNRAFANSTFGVVEDLDFEEGLPRKTSGFTGKELRPKRAIDRWPMFVLQITLEGEMETCDIESLFDESHQKLATIANLLQVIAHEFLKKHQFRPRAVNALDRLGASNGSSALASQASVPSSTSLATKRQARRPSPRVDTPKSHKPAARKAGGPDTRSASPFASWSRVKSRRPESAELKYLGSGTSSLDSEDSAQTTSEPRHSTANPLFGRPGGLLRKPFDDDDDDDVAATPSAQSQEQIADQPTEKEGPDTDDTIVWIDRATKIKSLINSSLINSRTGFMVNRGDIEGEGIPRRAQVKTVPSRSSKPPMEVRSSLVFAPTEPPIPCAPQVSELLGIEQAGHDCCGVEGINVDLPNSGVSLALSGRISKGSLRRAEVIGQVDRKFILAKIFTAHSDLGACAGKTERQDGQQQCVLVLIDQHAADERCRVEGLMKGYFAPDNTADGNPVAQSETLEKPLRFDLPRQEGELLGRFTKHFRHWGIFYGVSRAASAVSEDGAATVEVQSLPPSILERCRVEPRLVVELLRKQVWKLYDDHVGLAGSGMAGGSMASGSMAGGSMTSADAEHDWVLRFHDCPEGILDLINSRSCRSAIMFNDALTLDECSDLVQRLAGCAFPFQCAHGRPSMVPLLDLTFGCEEKKMMVCGETSGGGQGQGAGGRSDKHKHMARSMLG
ncbi:hypothetical protein B0T26DRAFT_725120 [Lasiosphaeria miniovina]|uniref:MutL C-terminal dimerisation domain-containing protein n=1 Tax=Lasiosphaeria miniovina TaxID=1954250 RepID=A0AA39ZYK2_9PEZI|nr:uncharacterized protein B0T26DRAFT_725120 [Lasiosphaeria miniovina]KAK0705975.1 hypothetical protein B0T26DRAFT_725120 [Lasiosphaeria miniovina]